MKLTQLQIIFALLIRGYLRAKEKGNEMELRAPHHVMGEWYLEQVNTHYFVSYKAEARLSELHLRNPGLLHREWIEGPSGAKYYGYRLVDITKAVGNPKLEEVVELLLPKHIYGG